jgi:carbon storage regulator
VKPFFRCRRKGLLLVKLDIAGLASPHVLGSRVDARQNDPPTTVGRTAMLVLSRKRDESIVINDNIVVTIVEVRGDKVRLGIEAPREVAVHRREIYDAIKESEKRDQD